MRGLAALCEAVLAHTLAKSIWRFWSTVEVAYEDLRPTVFGQPVDAPVFDPEQVSEIGIIIADSVDGTFLLEVDWIDAC